MKQNISRREFSQFPNLSQVECIDEDIHTYSQHLSALHDDFKTRFEDILTMDIPPWIINPFDETEVANVVLQEELLELSTNEELKMKDLELSTTPALGAAGDRRDRGGIQERRVNVSRGGGLISLSKLCVSGELRNRQFCGAHLAPAFYSIINPRRARRNRLMARAWFTALHFCH
ncbi:hypothetical protein EVAR_7342_1 [Eumeta japonica]|uniref:Uncharacterized protein n=1 Tax=Eumeta variegata TaxID=151549 RepID=A0A4C1T2W3_EUMVA|nr:hypothetical protein EVAR_7342_1 [Eumeta japonica]